MQPSEVDNLRPMLYSIHMEFCTGLLGECAACAGDRSLLARIEGEINGAA